MTPETEKLLDEARRAATAVYLAAEAGPAESISGLLVRLANALEGAVRRDAAPDEPATFGDPDGPAWQRGHFEKADEGEPLVEMACCAFRFSSYHSDDAPDNRKGHIIGGTLMYSCPMCAPGGVHDTHATGLSQEQYDALVRDAMAGGPWWWGRAPHCNETRNCREPVA